MIFCLKPRIFFKILLSFTIKVDGIVEELLPELMNTYIDLTDEREAVKAEFVNINDHLVIYVVCCVAAA